MVDLFSLNWLNDSFKKSFVISLQPRNQKEIQQKRKEKEKRKTQLNGDQDIIGLNIKQKKLVWTNHSMERKKKDKHTKNERTKLTVQQDGVYQIITASESLIWKFKSDCFIKFN